MSKQKKLENQVLDLATEVAALRAETERLKAAVMWALGDEGSDFGDNKPENAAPFWWRTELRRRAFQVSGTRPRE